MKKQLLMVTLSAVVLGSLASCSANGNPKPTNKTTKTEESLSKEGMSDRKSGQPGMMSKEEIVSMMPELTKKAKNMLVDNGKVIDPLFDMTNVQLLVVSNIGNSAYLINSQDEKYGKKDEVIEYATETLTEIETMTGFFGKTTLNGKDTYYFNVDTWTYIEPDASKEDQENKILDTMLHEAIHLYLQPLTEQKEGALSLQESGEDFQRTRSYPIDYQARIDRAQQTYYYREALKAKTESERISLIKEGNYFYEQFLANSPKNIDRVIYDKIEGQATYLGARGIATLSVKNKELDDKKLNVDTNSYLLRSDFIGNETIERGDEGVEFYTIGSLAYANIQELGHIKEIQQTNANPVDYLYKKYGVEETKGQQDLAHRMEKSFIAQNNQMKEQIERVDKKVADKEVYKVLVGSQMQSFEMTNMPLNYMFKDKPMTIETVSTEVKIGENRLKITQAEILKNEEGSFYLLVPKKDAEIKDGKISIQSSDIQLFDQPFKENDDVLELTQ